MKLRRDDSRELRIRLGSPLGCLALAMGLGGLVVLAGLVLVPLVGIALGAGLWLVGIGLLAVAWWHLRAWWRRLLGRGDGPGLTRNAAPADGQDETADGEGPAPAARRPHHRQSVEVRRRWHEEASADGACLCTGRCDPYNPANVARPSARASPPACRSCEMDR